MPAIEVFAAFAVASVILVVIPGPSVLFVIGRSLSLGRRGGLMSVFGNTLGSMPLVVAVAFGVGVIVTESIAVFTVIKLLGAAYLVYLGIQAIRHRRGGFDEGLERGTRQASSWTLLRQGFIVGISNPKTIVFLVAVLPQFVSIDAGAVPMQMLLLGVTLLVVGFICDMVWAMLAGTARAWFAQSPRRLSAISATGGVMMIGLGGVLALSSSEA